MRTLLMFTSGVLGACAPGEHVEFEPCTLPSFSSVAQCTTIRVPLSPESEHTLGLFVARLRAQGIRELDAPLVILAGGPGQGAANYGSLVETALRKVLEARDILLIDQRGTGRSHALRCPELFDLAFTAKTDEENRDAARECLELQAEDPRWFGTEAVIRDLNFVREELGYETIALWAASFGTRTALRYLARFPHRVEAVVLDGVTSNTESIFEETPRHSDAALSALAERCNVDARCDAEAFLARFDRLTTMPRGHVSLRDPMTGLEIETPVDGELIASTVRGALHQPSRTGLLPLALERATDGDFSVLAALSADTAAWSADTMAVGATLSILCTEDVDRIDPSEAHAAGSGSRFSDRYYRFWSSACTHWPRTEIPTDYSAQVESSVPALVLSGGLDPVTPPAAAKVAIAGLSNAQHLVAANVGHNVTPVGCAPDLIAEFLESPGAELDGSCLDDVPAPRIMHEGEIVQ